MSLFLFSDSRPARFGLAFIILLLFAPGIGASLSDEALLESSDGQVSIGASDLAQFIQERIPAQHHRQLVRDQSRLNSLLRSLFLQKRLFAAAQSTGHIQSGKEFFEVESSQRNSAIRQHIREHIDSMLNESYSAAARDFFDLHRSEFANAEQRAFSYVEFSSEDLDVDSLYELASDGHAWLVEANAALEELPRRYSDRNDVNVRGASLDPQERDQFIQSFAEKGFALAQQGDVSAPVVVDNLVHIIRLDQLIPAAQASFDEVEDELNERMRRRHAETIRERYRNAMVTDEDVVINADALQKLPSDLKHHLELWHEFGT